MKCKQRHLRKKWQTVRSRGWGEGSSGAGHSVFFLTDSQHKVVAVFATRCLPPVFQDTVL